MLSTSITLAIAATMCTVICRVSKWYVDNYCQDNPVTVWIWLDDDMPDKGHPVSIKTRSGIRQMRYSLTPVLT